MDINMNQRVLSIEQMNHLKELGVDISGASMAWQSGACMKDRGEWLLYVYGNCNLSYRYVEKTFTLQDMLTIMPKYLKIKTEKYCTPVDCLLMIDVSNDFVYYEYRAWGEYECAKSAGGANLLESAYNMLCWLAENDYLNKK